MSIVERRDAFDGLVAAFKRCVIPVLESMEFVPSIFSTHHFGADGRDAVFTFISLQEPRILDLIYFIISSEELSIKVFYNRIGLDEDVGSLSEFRGMGGLQLLLMPARRTEKEIHRWVPLPFLRIPKSYSVRRRASGQALAKSIDSVVTDLSNDIAHFDIIRSEWDEEHELVEMSISALA